MAELYDPAQHRHHAFVFGKDPFAITRVQAAIALFALGRPDAALASIAEGIAHLERFPHPFSEGWVRLGAAIIHGLRGEIALSREFAEAGVAQATIEGFPQWVAQGRVYIGWARVAQGDARAGLEEIRAGLEMWRMGGAQLLLPWLLVQYGEACLRADRPGERDRGDSTTAAAWPRPTARDGASRSCCGCSGWPSWRPADRATTRSSAFARAPSWPPLRGPSRASSCAPRSRSPSWARTTAGSGASLDVR